MKTTIITPITKFGCCCWSYHLTPFHHHTIFDCCLCSVLSYYYCCVFALLSLSLFSQVSEHLSIKGVFKGALPPISVLILSPLSSKRIVGNSVYWGCVLLCFCCVASTALLKQSTSIHTYIQTSLFLTTTITTNNILLILSSMSTCWAFTVHCHNIYYYYYLHSY